VRLLDVLHGDVVLQIEPRAAPALADMPEGSDAGRLVAGARRIAGGGRNADLAERRDRRAMPLGERGRGGEGAAGRAGQGILGAINAVLVEARYLQ